MVIEIKLTVKDDNKNELPDMYARHLCQFTSDMTLNTQITELNELGNSYVNTFILNSSLIDIILLLLLTNKITIETLRGCYKTCNNEKFTHLLSQNFINL